MLNARRKTFALAGLLAMAAASMLPAVAQRADARGNRLDFLTGYLTLTEAQVAQAKTIFEAESAAAESARGRMESAQTALNDAVKANKADAELDRLAAAMGGISGDMAAIHAKSTAKFAAILTSAQKDKFFSLRDRQQGGRPAAWPRRKARLTDSQCPTRGPAPASAAAG
jgi:Spy/CpxP family protein refolding chaperone